MAHHEHHRHADRHEDARRRERARRQAADAAQAVAALVSGSFYAGGTIDNLLCAAEFVLPKDSPVARMIADVREWQATQVGRNRIVVRFEMLPGATFDAARARERLNERLALAGFGAELDLAFEVVPQLTVDPGTGEITRSD